MLENLLKLHNIRYIVSVDDCYSDLTGDEMKDVLFGEMIGAPEKFVDLVKEIEKEDEFAAIIEMISVSGEGEMLIRDFLDRLTTKELLTLYRVIDTSVSDKKDLNDREKIVELLTALKKTGCIEDYMTYKSTQEALELEAERFEGMSDNEGILWLIDQDFAKIGESAEAGLELAKTIAEREEGPQNYIYILSGVKDDQDKEEEDIEVEFDNRLREIINNEKASLIYYIYKQRIIPGNDTRFAKSLAQGFKRRSCFKIFDLYIQNLQSSLQVSSDRLYDIRQSTLNFLLSERVEERGESHMDFLTRFVNIFQLDSYHSALSDNYERIADAIQYYRKLSKIAEDPVGDKKKETIVAKEYRRIEVYDFYVNQRHLEISMGDIFKINDKYYFLASQSCDTYLRSEGTRLLENATLLEILDNNNNMKYMYELPCFKEYNCPIINFHQRPLNYPFELLDLCVLDKDGCAKISCEEPETADESLEQLKYSTKGYKERIKTIIPELRNIVNDCRLLEDAFKEDGHSFDEKEELAVEHVKKCKPELLDYRIESEEICYDVQRIFRMDEMLAVDIVNKYGNYLSRIGHMFDFVSKDKSDR